MEKNIVYASPLTPTIEPLGPLLISSLKRHKNKIAHVDAATGEHVTFSDLLQSSCTMAHNLMLRGVKPGDIISIFSENRLEYAIPVLASVYIGAICSPLNPNYTSDDLIYDLNITKAKYIFCSERSLQSVRDAVNRGLIIEEVVVFDDVSKTILNGINNCKCSLFSDLIKLRDLSFNVEDFKPLKFDSKKQTVGILRSSGTTGFPKGVKLSCANLETYISASNDPGSFGLRKEDVMLGLLPLFHGYGYSLLLNSVVLGYQLIILQRFEERLFLSSIEKYKVTVLPLVPPLLVFLAKHPLVDAYDLSSVRCVFNGAAPVGIKTLREIERRLGFYTRQGYGMTELSVVLIITPPDVYKPESLGKLMNGAQAKVVDLETGEPLGPGISGELCFRGPYVMQGYYNNLEATKATIDKDGWLHTGDIGYYDQQEYFYIVDRIKELIKYKGFQVAPAELEAQLLSLTDIKDVAVIGIPDDVCGELPKAFVIKQPGSNITENDIIQFIAGKVSSHMKLRGGVEFIDEIPKSPSGKILRRHLRNRLKSKL